MRGPTRLPTAVERASPSRPSAASAPWDPEPARRDPGTAHAELHLDIGGHEATVFVRAFDLRETRRTLICLHGLPDNGSDFLKLGEAAAAAGFRVLCPDWPGRGRSDDLPPELYTLDTYFAVLRACLASAAGEITILANSFSNLVAILFLSRSKLAFSKLILVDPILRGGPAFDRVMASFVGEVDRKFGSVAEAAMVLRRNWPSVALLDDVASLRYALARVVRVGGKLRIACDPALGPELAGEIGRSFDLVELLPMLDGRVMLAYGADSAFKDPAVLAAVAAVRPDVTVLPDLPGGHAPLLRSEGEVALLLQALVA